MAQIDRPFVASQSTSTSIAEFVRQCYMRMLFPLHFDKPGYLYQMLLCEGIENPLEKAMHFIFAVQNELLFREKVTWDEQTGKITIGNLLSVEDKTAITDALVGKFIRGFPQEIIDLLLADPFSPSSNALQEKILLLASPFLDIQSRVKNFLQQGGVIDVRQSDILKDSLRMVTADPYSGLCILFHSGI